MSSNKDAHSQTQSSKRIQIDCGIVDSFITSKKKAFDFAPIFETARVSILDDTPPAIAETTSKNTTHKTKDKEPKRRKSKVKHKSNRSIPLESDNDSDSCYNEDNLSQGFNSLRDD